MMNRHPAYPSRQVLEIEEAVENAAWQAEDAAEFLRLKSEQFLTVLRNLDFPHSEPIPGHDLVDLIAVLELAAGIDPRKYGTVVGDIVRDRECENV